MGDQAVNQLKTQNERLKEELSVLNKTLQEAIQKQRQAEIERNRPKFTNSNDELSALHTKIEKLKRRRDQLKIQIAATSDDSTADMENHLVYLRRQLQEIEDEKATLENFQQKKKNPQDDGMQEQALKLREEIKKCREEHKEILGKMKTEEVQWKKDHQRMVALEERIRENKNKKNKREENKGETEVAEINKKIEHLKASLAAEEKKGKKMVAEAENNLALLEQENKELQEKLRSREEEVKLKEIKVKELKASVRNLNKKQSGDLDTIKNK